MPTTPSSVRVAYASAYEEWLMPRFHVHQAVSGVDSRITMKVIKQVD